MSQLLTLKQVFDLTGTRDPEEQKAVLHENRIPYVERRDGRPALTWDMVNGSQLHKRGAHGYPATLGFKLDGLNG